MTICDYCYEDSDSLRPFRGEHICRECRIELKSKDDNSKKVVSTSSYEELEELGGIMSDEDVINEYRNSYVLQEYY